ncbi:4-oxalocrotonate tautomerase [Acidipropionibacterium acidipropionici ATCC 4875]|jgi:phenylpyruvate tautomerase PptA (4-oxalocrotonate tautomerase family)|uniref:4-oxalocrotonate tautomerase n=1 Tax=Acidipropionibacterium acidipropionici (strain ATCC 4875 / DSM 20272 / JCM 6432 / NBRC 12425 / NCIMB 8070 / 4) TaxID=1171373 RepID=K7S0G4_ACIA4|nr:tautomerase family protein [Acidipropionibacterium acidipropionici]AFV90798.1 4-oxalocrotonate tautomerase [Acidipropionibacterium acidipropionici ATCC 4875]ALN15054.1 tautomerase [Acidipropionibacterium acidipropionici]APZ09197.1 tautomerase family protein [Acidipropionibacterium acidipropionici]
MPLVRIDLNKGRTDVDVRAISDAVHFALVDEFHIPASDRFQIVTQHDHGEIIAEDAGLGFQRDLEVVMINILTQAGRTEAEKQGLFARIAENLGRVGVAPQNVFIGYDENTPNDWSFGFGRSQYVTGELQTPAQRHLPEVGADAA